MIRYFQDRPILTCLVVVYIVLAIGLPILWARYAQELDENERPVKKHE